MHASLIITFVITAVCIVLVQNSVIKFGKPTWQQMKLDCLEKYKLDVSTFKKGNLPYDKICVYKCFYEKKGLMNSAGEFTLEEFAKKHPKMTKDTFHKIEDCVYISKKSHPCESAKAISDCIKLKKVKKLP